MGEWTEIAGAIAQVAIVAVFTLAVAIFVVFERRSPRAALTLTAIVVGGVCASMAAASLGWPTTLWTALFWAGIGAAAWYARRAGARP